jgi:glycosyltransferase involved in cell wall biosynthesis
MKKRVLMIGTDLNSHGGISRLQKVLVENWDNDKYTIKHLATHKDGTSAYKASIFIKSAIEFLFLLASYRPHLLHIHFSVNASLIRKSFFVLIGKFINLKVVLHAHTGVFESYLQTKSHPIQNLITSVLNLSDCIISLSHKEISTYKKYFNHPKIAFVENPIAAQSKSASLEKAQIISVGRVTREKGAYDLLSAAERVCNQKLDARFLLVGAGDLQIIEKILSEKSIKTITLTGWQPPDAILNYLLDSSIFVLPSYHEGMPMAILEAMSVGLPVISTKINGIPELVADGETGILVTPGDINALESAILKLLNEPETRSSMGEKGKARVETLFSIDVATTKLCQIYDELLLDKHNDE